MQYARTYLTRKKIKVRNKEYNTVAACGLDDRTITSTIIYEKNKINSYYYSIPCNNLLNNLMFSI
jgi:hypothetical protein